MKLLEKSCTQDQHKWSFRNCICGQWCKSFHCRRNSLHYPSPQGAAFEKTVLSLSFADGIVTQKEALQVEGEATPFIEHSNNTENNPPISVPPYRMNPARKELLKKELDYLLQQGFIVECESPAKCDTTGKTAAYLQFGREMRTIDDVTNDFQAIIDDENLVPEITLYLKRLARISSEVRERIEEKQDQRMSLYDKKTLS
ncbi:integrase catalytic domain-containing protein [Trichonephila clavipes]|nr:integrase catalytic domain-containing protein [Trichonephila clavipes]